MPLHLTYQMVRRQKLIKVALQTIFNDGISNTIIFRQFSALLSYILDEPLELVNKEYYFHIGYVK